MENEEIIKIISNGTIDEVQQALSQINDINSPIGYEQSDITARKTPIYILDIALLNSTNIEVIKFLLEKDAIYAKPFPYIISHCKAVGVFTLLLGHPNVKNPLLKIFLKIRLSLTSIPIFFVSSAMKNPNPEILKEVVSNKRVLNVLINEKRKGIDLRTYFKSISTENAEEKYKIFEELNRNLG